MGVIIAVLAEAKPVPHNVPVQSRTLDFLGVLQVFQRSSLFLDEHDLVLNWWVNPLEQNTHVGKKPPTL